MKTFNLTRWAKFEGQGGRTVYIHPETIVAIISDTYGSWLTLNGQHLDIFVKATVEEIETEINRAWDTVNVDLKEALANALKSSRVGVQELPSYWAPGKDKIGSVH